MTAAPANPRTPQAELALLRPEPHALLWPHTEAECRQAERMLKELPDDKAEELIDTLANRAATLENAKKDPLRHGIEPETWLDFDADLHECELLYISGPNRSTKSYYAAKRAIESVLAYPRSALLVVGATDISSKQIQQPLLWHFLEPHIGHLNWAGQHPFIKVRYSDAGGFTDGTVVLPNRSLIVIQTDNQDPKPWEGKEWGARVRDQALRRDGSPILNIGYWLDESVSLKWIEHATRRSRYRDARGLWSFTPKDGITPAVKEIIAGAKVLASKPARLLPNATVLGCPKGNMPYRLTCAWQKARVRVVYVHIDDNPMPDYREKELARLGGASTEMIERFGYGFARDAIARAFPQFGGWNIVDAQHLPEVGSNYVICDPHDARAWFITWVRVTPAGDLYVFDEWPDAQQHGEWAVPSERELTADTMKGWDGDRGPAQNARVDGIAGYKKIFMERATVLLGVTYADPMKAKLASGGAGGGAGVSPVGAAPPAGDRSASNLKRLLPIEDYYIDSRAGPRPHLEEFGQTCTVYEFDKEHKDADTGRVLEPVRFQVVSGDRIDLNLIRDRLAVQRNEDGKISKPPTLYVARECLQTIWALENYTGRSKEDGASKDPIDCLRYACGADLYHVDHKGPKIWRPGDDPADDDGFGN